MTEFISLAELAEALCWDNPGEPCSQHRALARRIIAAIVVQRRQALGGRP